MQNIDQLSTWNQCLDYLQDIIPSSLFSMWICPLQAQQLGDTLLLGAPNRIVFDEVNRVYLPLIREFFEERYVGKIKSFKSYVVGEISAPLLASPSFTSPAFEQGFASTDTGHESELNPDFTFRNFVIGKSNQLAEAAAEQVAISPGRAYNPLFLYGGVGLGKTHLMHAIGNRIRETKPHLSVRYLH
jgi:chromosomal replication initiator protein